MARARPARAPATPKERFDHWLKLVQAQFEATRRVDHEALTRTTEERRAFQLELGRIDPRGLAPADRAHGAAVARRIRELDLRIHACGATVLGVLDQILPDAAPTTYGRRGLIKGA